MGNEEDQIRRAHCNTCGRETKHHIIAAREQPSCAQFAGDPPSYMDMCTAYEMLECCGCQTVMLHRAYCIDGDTRCIDEEFYPPPVYRRLPHWRNKLPVKISCLLKEVYTALQANSRRLATMGARTLIDMVILDKVGDVGTFAKKVDALREEGFLSARNSEVITAALEAGSAAAHRGHAASVAEVNQVMDIVENLLQAVHVLESSAAELKNSTPPRERVTRKASEPREDAGPPRRA